MLGLALLFALLLDSAPARARALRPDRDLPAVRGAGRDRLAAVGLPLPAVGQPAHHGCSSVGLPAPDLLSPDLVLFAVANIAVWGGVGFNMIVLYTALRAIPTELYEAARHRRRLRDRRSRCGSRSRSCCPSLVMTAVFSLIATLQVFAEPTTLRPADQHDLHDLDAR